MDEFIEEHTVMVDTTNHGTSSSLTLEDGRCMILDRRAMMEPIIPTAGDGVVGTMTAATGQRTAGSIAHLLVDGGQRWRAGLGTSHMLHYARLRRGRLIAFDTGSMGAGTLRAQISRKYGVAVPADQPIFDRACRHGNFLRERFHRGEDDGRTPFSRHQHGDYGGQMLPLGEAVMWRDPTVLHLPCLRLEMRDLARPRNQVRHARVGYQARYFHSSNLPKASALGKARLSAASGDARNTVVNDNRTVR